MTDPIQVDDAIALLAAGAWLPTALAAQHAQMKNLKLELSHLREQSEGRRGQAYYDPFRQAIITPHRPLPLRVTLRSAPGFIAMCAAARPGATLAEIAEAFRKQLGKRMGSLSQAKSELKEVVVFRQDETVWIRD